MLLSKIVSNAVEELTSVDKFDCASFLISFKTVVSVKLIASAELPSFISLTTADVTADNAFS